MKISFLLLLTMLSAVSAAESGFSFTSGPLLFRPLVANTFEPRMGVLWHANDNALRLDIGNSVDMVQFRFDHSGSLLTFGSDFFTYTLLRGEKNFHFPVDAVDYLFGFNVNYRDTIPSGILTSRLRLSHISAHFVDGHYDGSTAQWKDGLSPRVFSREFFDLTVAFEPVSAFRGYAGVMYLWHVDPVHLAPFVFYTGGEFHQPFSGPIAGFGSVQWTFSDLRPRHEVHLGMKIGEWYGRGTKLFFTYHYGNSIHGEYFDRPDHYSGFGFNIDF